VSSVSNGLYFLTLSLVSVMRVIYTSKGMSKKFWGARYTLGARYLSKNTVLRKPEVILPGKTVSYTEVSDRVLAEQISWTLLISVSCSISLQPPPATISPNKSVCRQQSSSRSYHL
jgi:hypothetical protein